MPNTKSAAKRLRQNLLRRFRNRAVKSALRTARKKVLAAIEAKNVAESQSRLSLFAKLADRAAAKNIIHPNAAARYKSRLAQHIKLLKDKEKSAQPV